MMINRINHWIYRMLGGSPCCVVLRGVLSEVAEFQIFDTAPSDACCGIAWGVVLYKCGAGLIWVYPEDTRNYAGWLWLVGWLVGGFSGFE